MWHSRRFFLLLNLSSKNSRHNKVQLIASFSTRCTTSITTNPTGKDEAVKMVFHGLNSYSVCVNDVLSHRFLRKHKPLALMHCLMWPKPPHQHHWLIGVGSVPDNLALCNTLLLFLTACSLWRHEPEGEDVFPEIQIGASNGRGSELTSGHNAWLIMAKGWM